MRRLPRPAKLLSRPLRLPRLWRERGSKDAARIFGFNTERDLIVAEVTERIVEKHSARSEADLELLLNATAHGEVERLERQMDDESREELPYWRALMRRVSRMSEAEERETLREIVSRMSDDVAGNFDSRVYWLAQKLVPGLVATIMSPRTAVRQAAETGYVGLDDLIAVEGKVTDLHALMRVGTVVLVPTHSSNLDSLALGEALTREGLPPVVYGAGKNLFSNPITSFFMHNLGAYRVDRRVTATLYKEVLKTYSTVMIERGYHSLFFPGGTRSRTGEIEGKLKLGLAGTGVEAFARSCLAGSENRVFFIPVTINYALVLEAESLMQEWLRMEGRERYVMETPDDESTRFERWLSFFFKIASHEVACILRFGQALDPFGNPVDELGRSRAPDGRVVDPRGYLLRRDQVVLDPARDAAYTRELGRRLVESFQRETVLMSTQLVGHLLSRRLVRETPGIDLFGRMRRLSEVLVPREELLAETEFARARLVELEQRGEVHLSAALRTAPATRIVDGALAAWAGYHGRNVATQVGHTVVADDPPLLLFYGNRVNPWAERIADPPNLDAARELVSQAGRRS